MLQIIGLVWPLLAIGSVAVVSVTGSPSSSSSSSLTHADSQRPYPGECKLEFVLNMGINRRAEEPPVNYS